MTSDDTRNAEAINPVKEEEAVVKPAEKQGSEGLYDGGRFGILNDVSIGLTIEIGRTQIKIRDLLNLTKDSIIDLNKPSGEPVDIYANGKLIARGNIISANGKYCVRLVSLHDKP